MKAKKENRGGARAGAGRPPKSDKIVTTKYTIRIIDTDFMQLLTARLPGKRDAYIETAIKEKASKDGLFSE